MKNEVKRKLINYQVYGQNGPQGDLELIVQTGDLKDAVKTIKEYPKYETYELRTLYMVTTAEELVV